MERKEFLSLLGLDSASVFAAACLGGCSKTALGNVQGPPASVNINLDLSLPVNAALLTPRGYLYTNGIIVAQTTAGAYIAVSQACTHQGVSVQYIGSSLEFYCPAHGSAFSNTGAVVNGPASYPLTQYKTSLTGTTLTISSKYNWN